MPSGVMDFETSTVDKESFHKQRQVPETLAHSLMFKKPLNCPDVRRKASCRIAVHASPDHCRLPDKKAIINDWHNILYD